jgi:hypothetical protein
MNLAKLKERFRPSQQPATTASFVEPSFVVEIQPDFVAGARLDNSSHHVRRMGVATLEPGSVTPHPGRPNISNAAAVRQAVERVRESVGDGEGRAGLLVSDGAVRVAVLSFETVPDKRSELDSLVRWRMKENLPFSPEEARLSYQVSPASSAGSAGFEALVLAARGSVLSEYEAALEGADGRLILPATAALLPLLPREDAVGQLLVNLCSGWITSVVVWGDRVPFWRTREMVETEPKEQSQVVATEVARVCASARDHLQVEVPRVWLCVRPPATDDFASEVGRAVGQEVRLLAPAVEVGASLPSAERAPFERLGTPLAGLLMNSS